MTFARLFNATSVFLFQDAATSTLRWLEFASTEDAIEHAWLNPARYRAAWDAFGRRIWGDEGSGGRA